MKKIITIVLCILCAVNVLASCANTNNTYQPLTAYIVSSNVDGDNNTIDSRYRFQQSNIDDIPEPAQLQKSFTVLGNQFNAQYADKRISSYDLTEYTYQTSAGDKICVDANGNITQYESAASHTHYSKEAGANALSPEDSMAKAVGYLQQLFGAEVASRFSCSLPDTSTSKVWIHFKPTDNTIDGYTTSEGITLVLSETGELFAYYAHNVNSFTGKSLPTGFTDEKVKEIIGNSLSGSESDIELGDSRKLILIENGRLACTLSFRLTENGVTSEWASVVIPLE